MTRAQLIYLIELSKCKSFSEAAEHLFITQQALGDSIKKLEEEFNLKLCIRSRNGVRLTDEAMLILDDVKKIVEITNSWERLSEYNMKQVTGTVRVIIPTQFSKVIVDTMTFLKNEYPNIELIHFQDRSPQILKYLAKRNATIAIIFSNYEVSKTEIERFAINNDFCLKQLENKDRPYLYLNVKHPLAKQKEVSLKQCKDLYLASLFNEIPITNTDHRKFFSSYKFYQFHSHLDTFRMVSQNVDVATIAPEMVFENTGKIFQDNLARVIITEFNFVQSLFLLYPTDVFCSAAEKIVTDALQKCLKQN